VSSFLEVSFFMSDLLPEFVELFGHDRVLRSGRNRLVDRPRLLDLNLPAAIMFETVLRQPLLVSEDMISVSIFSALSSWQFSGDFISEVLLSDVSSDNAVNVVVESFF
jgi:hypothetical protein